MPGAGGSSGQAQTTVLTKDSQELVPKAGGLLDQQQL